MGGTGNMNGRVEIRPALFGLSSGVNDARWLNAVDSSPTRLRAVVGSLPEDALTTPSHVNEWSVAQVLSHLGSAVYGRNRDEDGLQVGGAAQLGDFRELFPGF